MRIDKVNVAALQAILDYTLDGRNGNGPCPPVSSRRLSNLLAVAEYHRLVEHLALWVRDHPPLSIDGFDPRRRLTSAAALSLEQHAAAAEVFRALSHAGIAAMMLRGPAVAIQYFPEPHLRSARDIDAVVHPESRDAAEEVLRQLGFRALGDRAYWLSRGELPFSRGRITVEIHWDPFPFACRTRLDPSIRRQTWDSSDVVAIEGTFTRCLAPGPLLLASSLHAACDHDLDRLVRLVDLRQILRVAGSRVDWDWFMGAVADPRCRAAAGLSLHGAARLVQAAVPAPVLAALHPQGIAGRIAAASLRPALVANPAGYGTALGRFLVRRTLRFT